MRKQSQKLRGNPCRFESDYPYDAEINQLSLRLHTSAGQEEGTSNPKVAGSNPAGGAKVIVVIIICLNRKVLQWSLATMT